MRLDDTLNLIVPIPRGAGVIYVHAAPLSREVFEAHWLVISKAFAVLSTEGLSIVSGPRVAGLALKHVAQNMGVWDGAGGVERSLVAEMVRLSNVLLPGDAGWQTVPLATALRDGMFSDREKSEVIGVIVFFTLNSAMHRAEVLQTILERAGDLWGTSTSSLDVTEFAASLQTSIAAESTGVTAPAASVPH